MDKVFALSIFCLYNYIRANDFNILAKKLLKKNEINVKIYIYTGIYKGVEFYCLKNYYL